MRFTGEAALPRRLSSGRDRFRRHPPYLAFDIWGESVAVTLHCDWDCDWDMPAAHGSTPWRTHADQRRRPPTMTREFTTNPDDEDEHEDDTPPTDPDDADICPECGSVLANGTCPECGWSVDE